MKNIKRISAILVSLGAMLAVGCAGETGPDDPSPEESTSTTSTAPAPAEKPIETQAATKCPPKPGYVLCSCGICAYESSCSSVCK